MKIREADLKLGKLGAELIGGVSSIARYHPLILEASNAFGDDIEIQVGVMVHLEVRRAMGVLWADIPLQS